MSLEGEYEKKDTSPGASIESISKAIIQNFQGENRVFKTSRNSGQAPLKDNFRTNRRLPNPTKIGKKREGEKGQLGHPLEFNSIPDEVVEHDPSKCSNCRK